MVDGFDLHLKDYCSNCGDFEPDVEKTEMTCFGDRAPVYLTTITCENAGTCEQISERLKERCKK